MEVVWQLQLVQYTEDTEISGVILEKKPPDPSASAFVNALRVTATYFVKPFAGKRIRLKLDKQLYELETDDKGRFSCRLHGKPDSIPSVFIGENPIPIVQNYPVVFPYRETSLAVISDIDDTVIRSYSAKLLRRMYTTLFKTSYQRRGIEYVISVYGILKDNKVPVYYVSKSESNLFGVLAAVFQMLDVPDGPFFLTPYLKFRELFQSKPANHKKVYIRKVLEGFPERTFLLFGDDTQRDMQVYHEIINEFPGRISKVYIHQTRKLLGGEKEVEFNRLKATGIPVKYFKNTDTIEDEIEYLTTVGQPRLSKKN